MDKKRRLVVERPNIVTLYEEKYSERQISEKLMFSKTAILVAVVRSKKFSSFQACAKCWKNVVQIDQHGDAAEVPNQ